MTQTEQLVEAVEYAVQANLPWWELFNSPGKALTAVDEALNADFDEEQAVSLLEAREVDIFSLYCTIQEAWWDELRTLRGELSHLDLE